MIEGPRWYCVQIRTQEQETAKSNLERIGFNPFFPEVKINVSPTQTILERAFPGYGFVYFDYKVQEWQQIKGTFGCIGLLPRHKDFPVPMPVGIIERLVAQNPISEETLYTIFDDYYPGMTIEYRRLKHVMNGRQATVLSVRSRLLEISFLGTLGPSNAIWVDQQYAVPVDKVIPDIRERTRPRTSTWRGKNENNKPA